MADPDEFGLDSLNPLIGPVQPAVIHSGGSGLRGHGGEQSMGFFLGERGYFFVEGPSGAGGHAANAAGFDGVAYNPTTDHLIIYDNKAFARAGNVYDASAITKNFSQNLNALIGRVQKMSGMPGQQQILNKLTATQQALNTSAAAWPTNVQVAVSNAGGQSTGVGGKLASGKISFIDYYAAPVPKPTSTPPPKASSTNPPPGRASGSGRPARAPNVQNIANALDAAWRWAEQQSMQNVFSEAFNELNEREGEISRAQRANPLYPVYIEIYYKIWNENNPHLYKIYQYLGRADINNGANGFPRGHTSFWDADQHRYLIVIPALINDPNKHKSNPGAPATWRTGYGYVVGALQGDRSTGGDPIAALRVLNGSPMYDILPILLTLKVNDPFSFNKLQQAVSWPTANVGVDRLIAAFFAVELSTNSTKDSFAYYKSACKEFHHLPEDQQKAIEDFLSGNSEKRKDAKAKIDQLSLDEAKKLLVGTWDVWIGNKGEGWNGLFKFTAGGGASWSEKISPNHGASGSWSASNGQLSWKFTAAGDFRTFTIKLPLKSFDAKGTILPEGQGWFSMSKL
jgi:hypothetical protein